ncbi:ABC transporter substrate-binding protein [Candidatus Poribacteria bacterium]|nr:ABC transporter substrate-binding protein [Candidatus Poribacteria bacterium]MYK94760.1 ABC transporter substrate-binding protein [Candidatus Poribacteria bacterium]
MKSFMLIMAIAILIVSLSACERISQITQPVTPQIEDKSDEISIGVVLPLTGHLASAGELMKEGFDLALSEINDGQLGHLQFKFIIEDDTSTAEGAVAAFNKLIHEDGVSVILGPASSSATEAAFPIAGENRVVAISPTAGKRGLGAISDFVFRIPLATDVVVAKGIEVTHAELGYQRVATMYDEIDGFSTDRDKALQEAFTAKGIEVLTTESFQSGDTDFSAQLTQIQALNPDAIFVSALPPEKPLILVEAAALGISAPFIVSSLTNVEVAAAGAAAEGAITFIDWLPTDDTPGNQAFVKSYSATYGMAPNVFVAASYVTVYILAEAIENAEATDSTAIRDALANIMDFDTVFGKFSFNANGDAVYAPGVLIVKDGTLQPFE